MSRNKIIMAFIVILIFASFVLAGCGSVRNEARASGNSLVTTGTVEAKEVDVSSKIPGRIIKIHVEEGQEVKEGALLFEIDPKDLEVKKLQAEAAVKGAEAQLNKAINGARKQEIAAAKALLNKAEANVELLEKKYDRLLPLYEAEALPKDTLDEIETKLAAARLDALAARQKYDMALEGARAEDIQALEAQYQGVKAKLQEVLINLEETEVTAPIGGSVSLIIGEQGELVGSGMPVITIIDYQDIWVETNVDEEHMGKVKIGQSVEVKSKAYPNNVFKGEVVSIIKNPDFAIKKSTNELNDQDIISYAVKVKLLDCEEQLYPGMLVDVFFGNEG